LSELRLEYWQLEKRLFAIRRSLREYKYEALGDAEAEELVKRLVLPTLRRASPPAIVGTICCAAGALPPGVCGGLLLLAMLVVHVAMHRKMSSLASG